jgi:hypothetical protein
VEDVRAHEDRLVAGGDAGPPRAPVHERLHHPQQRPMAGDANVEASPRRTGAQGLLHERVGPVRQPRIGMQEQQRA